MAKYIYLLIIAAAIFTLRVQADCPTTSDRVITFPNYVFTGAEKFCVYSGHVQVDKGSLYYLFFYTLIPNLPYNDIPMIMWPGGDVGESSLNALFNQNGPFKIDRDPGTGKVSATLASDSLLEAGHVLYIDSNIGVGLSFANENKIDPMSDTDVANNLKKFLSGFLTVHPETSYFKWFFSGNKYAARINPLLYSSIISDANPPKIDFGGFLLGNPFVDGSIQVNSLTDLTIGASLINENRVGQLGTLQSKCDAAIRNNNQTAFDSCSKVLSYLSTQTGQVNPSNILEIGGVESSLISDFFNQVPQADLIKDLHLSPSFARNPVWIGFNSDVYNAMKANIYSADSARKSLDGLNLALDRSKIMFYFGQYDLLNGVESGTLLTKFLKAPYGDAIESASRYLWKLIERGKSQTAGYVKTYNNLTLVTVVQAGSPIDRERQGRLGQLFFNFMQNKTLITPGESEITDDKCRLMNNCNGHGNCDSNTGRCTCNNGYGLEDCSLQINEGGNSNPTLGPLIWYYFKARVNAGQTALVKVRNDKGPVDLYASYSAPPNEFNHDAKAISSVWTEEQTMLIDGAGDFIYIGVRNPSFNITITPSISIDSNALGVHDSDFFDKPNGGYIIIIVLFSLGIVFVLGGAALLIKVKFFSS